MLTELKAWLWLTRRLECGPAWQVLRHFGGPERAYFADPAEYALIPRLSPAQRQALGDKSLDREDQILARCDRAGIGLLTWQDSLYPERLRNIELPPLVLYFRGTLPRFDEEIAIAMAGTRRATWSVPLRAGASTQRAPRDRPASSRFRAEKCSARWGVPGGYSLMRAPQAAASSSSRRLASVL